MKKCLSLFSKLYSWFNKIPFAVRIIAIFLMIYFGLFYISGVLAGGHWYPTNFKWVFNATKNDYGVVEENVLKLIEITISALAFTGLIASILYQRDELLVTKSQLKDQAEHLQRSIDETNKNFERNILNNFNDQVAKEIENSDFQEISLFLTEYNKYIWGEHLALKTKSLQHIEKLKLLSLSLLVPPTSRACLDIISKKINVNVEILKKFKETINKFNALGSHIPHSIMEDLNKEFEAISNNMRSNDAQLIFQKNLNQIELRTLRTISNMLKAVSQFNTDKIKISNSDPVFLLLQSSLDNSNFIYEDSYSDNNFRIEATTLRDFFTSIGLIEAKDIDGSFGGYSESIEFEEFLKLMQEYGVIRDAWHFGHYVILGEPSIDEHSTKE